LSFQRKIICVNVDEAHFIYTAGLPLYGLPPFRPAWGRLDEIKKLFGNHVRWKAFSATFPPHILQTVAKKVLKINHIPIRVTSNRPNTIYATHQGHRSIEDARNYECFIKDPFDFMEQPHVLIFFDDKDLTSKVAQHLNTFLHAQYRGRGIVRHYHSGMSEKYLQQAHDSFVKEDGVCRVLVTTSGQSVVSLALSRINSKLI
jgi:superfamily II DNA helicase RecQ